MEELINKYYKIFPKAHFTPEWFDIPNKEKIEILKEAIKDKKDITQTKLYKKYEERVIIKTSKN